jgi:uncharacterized protein (TIGR02246 family)
MKHSFITCLFSFFAAISFSQTNLSDEAAIKSIIQKQEDLWNKHDMVAFSQFYTDDATLINFIGMFWKGKKDIIEHFIAINDCCLVPTSVKFEFISLRNIAPGIAIVYVEETIVADKDYDVPGRHYKKGETDYKLITNVFVKENTNWKITATQLTLINQVVSPHNPGKKN